tara:strand:+ start:347 stop:583 length:237 start_codon:yes stop_codon:yes gene_type:complete
MEKLDRILHDLDQGNTNVTDAKKLVLDLFIVSKSLMSEYKEEKPLILKNILYEFTDHKTSSINEVDFEDVVKRIIEEA